MIESNYLLNYILIRSQVLESSTLEETNCRCRKTKTSGSIFATSFYVPPNSINFDTILSKIDFENAAVYGTLIGIYVVTIVFMVYLRKKDKRDLEKVFNQLEKKLLNSKHTLNNRSYISKTS